MQDPTNWNKALLVRPAGLVLLGLDIRVPGRYRPRQDIDNDINIIHKHLQRDTAAGWAAILGGGLAIAHAKRRAPQCDHQ
jgi:hypothetical protein